jgi:hypothetical protein
MSVTSLLSNKPMTNLSLSIQENASSLANATAEELETSYLIGSSSHKIELSNKAKGQKYLSSILYLLQEGLSGHQVCPWATDSCKEVCLGTNSGHSAMLKTGNKTNVVQIARLKRTLLFKNHKDIFLAKFEKELQNLVKAANKKGVKPAFRFNGTSDLMIEHFGLIEKYPEIQWYDYTKSKARMIKFLSGKLPSNYHLTFSFTPENEQDAQEILSLGGNVAVVFNEKATKKHAPTFVGKTFLGHTVINGDVHDLRFDDPQGGYVVGLTRKGRKKDLAFFIDPTRCEVVTKEAVA